MVWGVVACPNAKSPVSSSFGAAAVTLAGYSAYAKRANRALAADQAVAADRMRTADFQSRRQDRQAAFQTALDRCRRPASYALASAQPDAELERAADPVIAADAVDPRGRARASPQPKPKTARTDGSRGRAARDARRQAEAAAAAAAPRRTDNGLLDDGQIAGLKGRLRLTSDQVEYWPAVEAALRDVVRTQLRGTQAASRRQGQHRHQQPRSAEADLGGDAAADAAARGPEERSPQARARDRAGTGRRRRSDARRPRKNVARARN